MSNAHDVSVGHSPEVSSSAEASADDVLGGVPEYGWVRRKVPLSYGYVGPVIFKHLDPVTAQTRILDIGCGTGYVTGSFAERCSLVGIDPSAEGISMARRDYPQARWERLSAVPEILDLLGDQPFDFVVSVEVVEHVYLPRLWAKACFNALRPGGTLIATTPYHGYLKNLALSLTDSWDTHINPLWDGGHIKLWSKTTLSRLLAEAGFRDIRFFGCGRVHWLWKSMAVVAQRP